MTPVVVKALVTGLVAGWRLSCLHKLLVVHEALRLLLVLHTLFVVRTATLVRGCFLAPGMVLIDGASSKWLWSTRQSPFVLNIAKWRPSHTSGMKYLHVQGCSVLQP